MGFNRAPTFREFSASLAARLRMIMQESIMKYVNTYVHKHSFLITLLHLCIIEIYIIYAACISNIYATYMLHIQIVNITYAEYAVWYYIYPLKKV